MLALYAEEHDDPDYLFSSDKREKMQVIELARQKLEAEERKRAIAEMRQKNA